MAERLGFDVLYTPGQTGTGGDGAPQFTRPAGEERKIVTVLFADLVGSTGLADADRAIAIMTKHLKRTADRVRRAG